jgi:hypothetical protein
VIGNSGKWVIEKQMANGNQQLARAKMILIGMFRLSPLELGMKRGGTHRVIGNSGNRVIEKQMANGNHQLARAKMILIGMFRLSPLELGMKRGVPIG